MAGYVQKENSGSLFKNDKKESDKHPNAKGSALIGGVEYWVSAWTYQTKDGQPYQSLSFQRKDDKGKAQSSAPKSKAADDDFNSDIPF